MSDDWGYLIGIVLAIGLYIVYLWIKDKYF